MDTYSKTIVCFGDSNTHGYNAENEGRFSEKERWTCLLSDMLGTSYLVREEGLNGRTNSFEDPLFESLNGFSHIHPCIMTHEPVDLLIIMLGTNDTKQRFSATSANIAKGLEHLVNKAKSVPAWRDGKPNILIIAPPAINPGYSETSCGPGMGEGCDKKSKDLAPLYKTVADSLGCHFIDAGAIEGIEMHPADHMHLTLQSHALLAKKLSVLIPEIV